MQCKKCGAVVPEGGIFCANCGTRTDGKKSCNFCNNLVDENTVFCTFCGARLDGKKQCSNCGNFFDGTFCPACGCSSTNERKNCSPKKELSHNNVSFAKVERLLSPSLLLGALLVLFICSFFIGFTVKAPFLDSIEKSTTTIFHFFGDAYRLANVNIASAQKSLPVSALPYYSLYLKLPIIFVTVFGAINLLVSFASFVYGSIKYCLALKNGRAVNLRKVAFLSFASFLCASIMLLSYSVNIKTFGELSFSLSPGSLSGIIIGTIFILSSIVLSIIKNATTSLNKIRLHNLFLGVLLFALVFVCFFLLKSFVRVGTEEGSLTFSSPFFFTCMSQLLLDVHSTNSSYSPLLFNELATSAVTGYIFFILALICLGALIYFSLCALSCEKPYKLLLVIFSILLFICSLGYFITSIIAKDCLVKFFEFDPDLLFSIGTIAFFVLTCLSYFVVLIFYKKFD